jgi:integrase
MTSAIVPSDSDRQLIVGSAADHAARSGVFADYQARRAMNTLRHQLADLTAFASFLEAIQFYPPTASMGERKARGMRLYHEPGAWAGITYGLVAGFVRWELQQGYAIGTVNVHLSTVKKYASLAFQAGTLSAEQHALIRTVSGYQYKEQKRVDEKRTQAGGAIRRGAKKDAAVSLTDQDVRALKMQPDTPQGRRDALIMAILLDLSLRVGELALLEVKDVNLKENTLTFFRPKVGKRQTLELKTNDLRRAFQAWFNSGDAPAEGKLLRASERGGGLGANGMKERAITQRVEYLGRRIGIVGLSAHDLRHSWATRASRAKTDAFALQEGGGWNSLAMPRRYVEAAKIANEGVELGDEA